MTDTPETDAMEYFDAMCSPDRVVEADFARKLERERDEAREQRNRLAEALEYILGIGLTEKTKAKAEKALQIHE